MLKVKIISLIFILLTIPAVYTAWNLLASPPKMLCTQWEAEGCAGCELTLKGRKLCSAEVACKLPLKKVQCNEMLWHFKLKG